MTGYHNHRHILVRAVITGAYELDEIKTIQRLHFLADESDIRLESFYDRECLGAVGGFGHFHDTQSAQQLLQDNPHKGIVSNDQKLNRTTLYT